ncbi:hypothetical protein DYBT9623_05533 [Dyadobacter sp. CECT 9623]|uniref:Uncharacterized protein n=1 Tax=Dyadobacter linearis TaxID=2823330 RepID=A0ABM8UZL7_9BACT|nr:hypothetical protein [Dyadobacter sp. CECT 9623]CAG5074991.1 hypothetical protein DYBT9623_05533 [Dyadobacter sp. CECT 9623]
MDRNTLVRTLAELFVDDEKVNGLVVDAIGLAPAYNGMVKDSYVLGVSAPGMEGRDCFEKADTIIDLLFAHLSEDVRRMIDRVRVYESADELKSYADNDFNSDYCDVCERPVNLNAQVYEVTA